MNSKTYKKFLRLMEMRGFKITDKQRKLDNFDDFCQVYEKEDQKIVVLYIESDKNKDYIGASSLRIFIKKILELGLRKGILISKYALGMKSKPIINNFLDYLTLEFITLSNLRNSPSDHYFCKEVEKVTDIEYVKDKYKIKNLRKELTKISLSDPICQRFGFMENDIILVKGGDQEDKIYMHVS